MIGALNNIRIMNKNLEVALTVVRKRILNIYSTNQDLTASQLQFSLALVVQLFKNEYIYVESEEEAQLCELIRSLILAQSKNSSWSPSESHFAIIILLMYMPISKLVEEEAGLKRFNKDKWPIFLQWVYQADIIDRARERKLSKTIEQVSEIENSVSNIVRQQYEQNPYPRWDFHRAIKEYDFGSYVGHSIGRPTSSSNKIEDRVRVLVAGCGTGRQPIEIARQIPSAEIVAVDISLVSLGYAKRKSEELGLRNIDFLHGDILELGKLDKRFDLIACCGVLHHMENPLDGWRVLRNLLKPNGLMHIALYSEIAREGLNQHREYIKTLNLKPTINNIRQYRASAMNTGQSSALVEFSDFWNTSECRDLIFHVQEHQFTWLGIKNALKDLDLELSSVTVPQRDLGIFKSIFPEERSELELENWHSYEKLKPRMFAGMYNFWCQVSDNT